MKEIKNCPSCLKPGFDTYCPACRKKLFNNRKVSHILEITRPEFNQLKRELAGKISISGIQVKHSLCLVNEQLELTDNNGEYILKPVPSGSFEHLIEVPANEHLTMQIANQVYGINTAENALIFFSDSEPAYITKRFDVLAEGKKLLQEDFAQIGKITEDNHGKNYKYDYSYEEIALLMKQHVKAYLPEIERYFKVIIFNYLFSNGDAHVKNFSLARNDEYGDYLLTPFYDLLNTSIHVPGESDMALDLFKDDFVTESYKAGTNFTAVDFIEFGKTIGISGLRIEKIINVFNKPYTEVENLINNSFLTDEIKTQYTTLYLEKLKRLQQA
jgi:serine/threonine-protein kinase HipA